MHMAQLLKATDIQRVDYAVNMQALFRSYHSVLLLMSDQAQFHLNGSIINQSFRYWAPQNPEKNP